MEPNNSSFSRRLMVYCGSIEVTFSGERVLAAVPKAVCLPIPTEGRLDVEISS